MMTKPDLSPILISLAKYTVAFGALGFVLWQIDATQVWTLCRTMPWPHLLAALIFLNLSQAISALRTRLYLGAWDTHLSHPYAFVLYYAGMFYNTVLPGGFGGDGYKVFLLKSRTGLPVSEGVRIMLAERANGLLVLITGVLLTLPFSALKSEFPFFWLLMPAGLAATLIGYFWAGHKITREPLPISLKASLYSFGVQGLVTLSILSMLMGLNVPSPLWIEYLLLFHLGTVASVLPVTVGGVGLRELLFFTGAAAAGIQPEAGVAVSILWFILYLASSLTGLVLLPTAKRMEINDGRA